MAPQSVHVGVVPFIFQIIVFNSTNDVLCEGVVSAYHVAFETMVAVCTVHGVSNNGGTSLVIVFAVNAEGAFFSSFSASIGQTDNESIIITIDFLVRIHVVSSQVQVFSQIKCYANIPDLVVVPFFGECTISESGILEYSVTSGCSYSAKFSVNFCTVNIIILEIYSRAQSFTLVGRFSIETGYFNVFAIGSNNALGKILMPFGLFFS